MCFVGVAMGRGCVEIETEKAVTLAGERHDSDRSLTGLELEALEVTTNLWAVLTLQDLRSQGRRPWRARWEDWAQHLLP